MNIRTFYVECLLVLFLAWMVGNILEVCEVSLNLSTIEHIYRHHINTVGHIVLVLCLALGIFARIA